MPHSDKNCISIFLTNRCNLSCIYCYCEKNPIKQSIDINFAKKGIDDFFKKNKFIYLRIFGDGEPTIEFNKIQELIRYAKIRDKKAKIELQTNGLFSEKIAKYIAENIDIVWISHDGTPDAQNFYRPTINNLQSNEVVEKNIKYLAEKIEYLGVRITIGRKNVYKQIEIINYLDKLGVKYIYTDLLFKPINRQLLDEDIKPIEYVKKFLKAKKYAKKFDIFYGSFFEINFDGETNISCRACIPSPHLTIDGHVTCCDMAHNNKNFPELVYGKYNKNSNSIIYFPKKIKFVQSRRVGNIPECQECEIKYFCAGGCLGEALNEKGSIFKIKKENCKAIKLLAKSMGVNKGRYPIFHP